MDSEALSRQGMLVLVKTRERSEVTSSAPEASRTVQCHVTVVPGGSEPAWRRFQVHSVSTLVEGSKSSGYARVVPSPQASASVPKLSSTHSISDKLSTARKNSIDSGEWATASSPTPGDE